MGGGAGGTAAHRARRKWSAYMQELAVVGIGSDASNDDGMPKKTVMPRVNGSGDAQ